MTIKQKSGFLLAFCLAFFLILPVQATETGSLYIDYHTDNMPLPFVDYGLYYLYTVDEEGEFTPTPDYEKLGSVLDLSDNEAWVTQSQTANNFIIAYGLSPDIQGETDDMGRGMTVGLAAGIYLLKFDKTILDEMAYEADPILVVVSEEEDWSQSMIPKVKSYPEAELTYRTVIVLKTWRNDHDLGVRPEYVTINLYQDGSLEDSIFLGEHNSWSYKWDNLDGNSEWAILEEDLPEGYTVEITYEKDTMTTIFHVQNTYENDFAVGGGSSVGVGGGGEVEGDYHDTDVEGALTETGALMWPIPLLFGGGFALLLVGFALRKDKNEETNS